MIHEIEGKIIRNHWAVSRGSDGYVLHIEAYKDDAKTRQEQLIQEARNSCQAAAVKIKSDNQATRSEGIQEYSKSDQLLRELLPTSIRCLQEGQEYFVREPFHGTHVHGKSDGTHGSAHYSPDKFGYKGIIQIPKEIKPYTNHNS